MADPSEATFVGGPRAVKGEQIEPESVKTDKVSDTDVWLHEHPDVSGSGTDADPYTSPSGTAGFREVWVEYGGAVRVRVKNGVWSFTDNVTPPQHATVIGPGTAQASAETAGASEEGSDQKAFFRADWDPNDSTVGAIFDADGTDHYGWQIEGVHFVDSDSTHTSAAIHAGRLFRCAFEDLAIGGSNETYGFTVGMELGNVFRGYIKDVEGASNGKLIRSASGALNQFSIEDVYGSPENANDPSGIGSVVKLAGATGGNGIGGNDPRGVTLQNVGGGGSTGHTGIELVACRGVAVVGPYLEGFPNQAIQVTGDAGNAEGNRSTGNVIIGGWYTNNNIAIHDTADRTQIFGGFIETPDISGAVGIRLDGTRSDASMVEIGSNVDTPDELVGAGVTRDGVAIESLGTGNIPTATDYRSGTYIVNVDDRAVYYVADIFGAKEARQVSPIQPTDLSTFNGSRDGQMARDDGTNTASGRPEQALWDATNSVWYTWGGDTI